MGRLLAKIELKPSSCTDAAVELAQHGEDAVRTGQGVGRAGALHAKDKHSRRIAGSDAGRGVLDNCAP